MNICIIGSAGVGKSSYICRILDHVYPAPADFNSSRSFTYVTSFASTGVNISEARTLEDLDLDTIKAFIVIFDLTQPSSLTQAALILSQIKGKSKVLVGNKTDSPQSQFEVISPLIEQLRKHYQIQYYDISCKTCYQIGKPLKFLTTKAIAIPE